MTTRRDFFALMIGALVRPQFRRLLVWRPMLEKVGIEEFMESLR